MDRTTFREPYPAPSRPAGADGHGPRLRLSQAFHWNGATFAPREIEYLTSIAPVGAASSTASDMARYMLAILADGTLDGATIYSPATAKAFRTPLGRAAPGVNAWDHGFMEFALPGGYRGYGHGGATLYFHSNMVTVPALGLGVFVTTNTDTGRPFAARLPGEIVGRFYAQRSLPLAGAKSLYENRKAYEGRYHHHASRLRRAREVRQSVRGLGHGQRHQGRPADHRRRRRGAHLGAHSQPRRVSQVQWGRHPGLPFEEWTRRSLVRHIGHRRL